MKFSENKVNHLLILDRILINYYKIILKLMILSMISNMRKIKQFLNNQNKIKMFEKEFKKKFWHE